jgi:hypothetical protein
MYVLESNAMATEKLYYIVRRYCDMAGKDRAFFYCEYNTGFAFETENDCLPYIKHLPLEKARAARRKFYGVATRRYVDIVKLGEI